MYIRSFDGLRALAMFLVFLTHKTQWGADSQIGFAGVWIFFLLSGFLIGNQLFAARRSIANGRSTVSKELGLFWLKRALRIFPAYYALITLLVPFYVLTDRSIPGLPYYLTYLSNFYFQQHQPAFMTTWAHFWTLAVEEQFYVLFAPLMLLVPARHAALACLVLIMASLFQRFGLATIGVEPYLVYIDSLVNFGLLGLGAFLFTRLCAIVRWARSLRLDNGAVGWFAAAVITLSPISSFIAGPNLILLQVFYLSGALFAAVLLINVLINQKSLLVCVLEVRPIAYFGRVSYGVYLYNDYVKSDLPKRALNLIATMIWPAGSSPPWLEALLRDGSAGDFVIRGMGIVTCFAVLFAVAHLSWVCVERPALRVRGRVVAYLESRHAAAGGLMEERLDVSA